MANHFLSIDQLNRKHLGKSIINKLEISSLFVAYKQRDKKCLKNTEKVKKGQNII